MAKQRDMRQALREKSLLELAMAQDFLDRDNIPETLYAARTSASQERIAQIQRDLDLYTARYILPR